MGKTCLIKQCCAKRRVTRALFARQKWARPSIQNISSTFEPLRRFEWGVCPAKFVTGEWPSTTSALNDPNISQRTNWAKTNGSNCRPNNCAWGYSRHNRPHYLFWGVACAPRVRTPACHPKRLQHLYFVIFPTSKSLAVSTPVCLLATVAHTQQKWNGTFSWNDRSLRETKELERQTTDHSRNHFIFCFLRRGRITWRRHGDSWSEHSS